MLHIKSSHIKSPKPSFICLHCKIPEKTFHVFKILNSETNNILEAQRATFLDQNVMANSIDMILFWWSEFLKKHNNTTIFNIYHFFRIISNWWVVGHLSEMYCNWRWKWNTNLRFSPWPENSLDSNYQLLNLFIDGWRILEAGVPDNDRILDRSVLQVIASDFNKTCNITAIVFC